MASICTLVNHGACVGEHFDLGALDVALEEIHSGPDRRCQEVGDRQRHDPAFVAGLPEHITPIPRVAGRDRYPRRLVPDADVAGLDVWVGQRVYQEHAVVRRRWLHRDDVCRWETVRQKDAGVADIRTQVEDLAGFNAELKAVLVQMKDLKKV